VIEAVHAERPDAVISIDTMKPEVAYHAVRAGAGIINDVSGGFYDERIWKVAADENVPYVLMHGYDPNNLVPAESVVYRDVVQEVYRFLDGRISHLRRAGIEHVIADVGIGFAKGATDNIRLIQGHSCFSDLGVPLLIGLSRKSFIGRILRGAPPKERLFGTLAALAIAVSNGASIVRVHDVQAVREFFDVYNVLRHRPDGQMSLYLGIDDDNSSQSRFRVGSPSI
jgi:dihydropteroate synthase